MILGVAIASPLTQNKLIKYDTAYKTADSIITDDGSLVSIAGDVTVDGVVSSIGLSVSDDWRKVIESPSLGGTGDHEVFSMVDYDGKLYIGYFDHVGTERAELWEYDGENASLFYTFGTGTNFRIVSALAVYNGELYAGIEGLAAGSGDIYKYDKSAGSWAISYDSTEHNACFVMEVFNNKLYGGMGWGTGDGDILAFDGSTWTTSFDSTLNPTLVEALEVFNGKLYAGVGGSNNGDAQIKVFDKSTWTNSYDGSATTYEQAVSLKTFNGSLYAGMLGSADDEGDILSLSSNSLTWTTAYANTQGDRIHALEVYDKKLYAGNGNAVGQNDILSFDGVDWTMSFDGLTEMECFRLYAWNGSLYAGMGFDGGMANTYRLTNNLTDKFSRNDRLLNLINLSNNGYDENEISINAGVKITGFGADAAIGAAPLTVGAGTGKSSIILNGSKGNDLKSLEWRAEGLRRWRIGVAGTETGSGNAGSDLYFQSYDDAGAYISGSTLYLDRATKRIGLGNLYTSAMQGHVQVRGLSTTTGINFLTESSAGTDGLAVLDNGNVGITTTTPTEKLDVIGNIKASGYKSSDGSSGFTGSMCTSFKNGLCVSGT